ncbi:ABC transporter substrate-binding protein, partial [Rhizobium ruizarguesonis]
MLFKAHGNGSNSLKRGPSKASLCSKGELPTMLKAQTKMQFLGCLGLASMLAAASPALALDKVSYGTN